jgi:hypothetical protein
MLARHLTVAVVVLVATGCAATGPTTVRPVESPPSLVEAKRQVSAYVDSGRYQAEVAAVAEQAVAFLRPDDLAAPTAAEFKAPERRKLQDQGYTIIVNIGDQTSDLEGGFAERTYKLPNPFYVVP